MNYNDFYKESLENPEQFWGNQANVLDWFKKPTNLLSKDANDYPLWFEDGELNACYLAIDKHINDGFGENIAFIYDSPVTQTIKKFTFNQVKTEVAKLAGGLLSLGLQKGDTVTAIRKTKELPSIHCSAERMSSISPLPKFLRE